jgi:hypothetical protein
MFIIGAIATYKLLDKLIRWKSGSVGIWQGARILSGDCSYKSTLYIIGVFKNVKCAWSKLQKYIRNGKTEYW